MPRPILVHTPSQPAFYDETRVCSGLIQLSWVICGDFNIVFSYEIIKGNPIVDEIYYAHEAMCNLNLIEPSIFNKRKNAPRLMVKQKTSGFDWTISYSIKSG